MIKAGATPFRILEDADDIRPDTAQQNKSCLLKENSSMLAKKTPGKTLGLATGGKSTRKALSSLSTSQINSRPSGLTPSTKGSKLRIENVQSVANEKSGKKRCTERIEQPNNVSFTSNHAVGVTSASEESNGFIPYVSVIINLIISYVSSNVDKR